MIKFQLVELVSRVCFCSGKQVLRDLSVRSIAMVPLEVKICGADRERLIPEIFLQ
jgi:hypothetical protein